MERLNRQVQETQKLLSDPETDWKDCSAAIEELATAVESLGRSVSHKDAVRVLLSLSVGIGMQLVSIRSKLVKDVCEHLLRIVKVTGRDFQDMANDLLPQIIGTAKSASAAIRQPGNKLLCKISEVVRYDLSLMRKIYVQLMQDKARVLVLEQLRIIFVYWSDNEVLQWESDVLEIVRRGLEDQNEKVRKTAREVLTRFSSRWSERVDELVDLPSSQSKALLISEHRDSPLAEAILKSYPELASKSDSFSRSRSSFTQSRSSFRKSPRHKRERNIEIHVSATPPPKQREQQEVMIQETSTSEVSTSIGTRRTIATPESTERGRSSVSRRLFDNPDFSDGAAADQQDDTLEAFDGSKMYGFHSKPAAREFVHPPVRDVEDTLGPPAIPSRADVARVSSASSPEQESLRRPSTRQLKVSEIPSPSSRSPSLLSKKRLESPTRATDSPELRPSLLALPSSFTFKARGSNGPSTPVGSAVFEEDKAETNHLSESDEYFSKPIPSSIAAPVPPPLSADNVTLRPRRRTYVGEEQENSPLQTYSSEVSSPEPPASAELARPRQVEITPESVVCSPFDQDVSPLHEEHYAGYAFDETDDIGDLSEGSDNIGSNKEWNHRRLDDLQSLGYKRSEEEDTDQPQQSIVVNDDNFPDEWHLDDGPRHKFSLEDEIGERLSDDDHDPAEFVGGTDDEHKTSTSMDKPKVSEMEWQENAGSSPQEYFTKQHEYEEEETIEEEGEPAVEMKVANAADDALTGLLNVRDEMTRLRAITRNEENSYDVQFKEQYKSATHYALNTVDPDEESQERSPATRTARPWDERGREESEFLKMLKHADRVARSPLIAPPASSLREEKGGYNEPLSPLQTFEMGLHHAAASVEEHDEHEQSEDRDFLDLQAHSLVASPEFAQATATIDEIHPESFNFTKEPQLAENVSPRAKSKTSSQEIVHDQHDQESCVAHDDQARRFDAAEKLFATKEALPVHAYYDRPKHEPSMRPQLPEQELHMQSEPYTERYPPPTQMGAKMASAFANAQRNVLVKDIGNVAKDEAAEEMIETDDAKEEDTPKKTSKQAAEEISPLPCQPVPDFVETAMPTSDENKHDANPTPPATTPPTTIPERISPQAHLSWLSSFGISIAMLLAAVFCLAGILHAAKTVNETREYHLDLKSRIDRFEASIVESHKKVLKLEEDYAVWSVYVRKLTEEDETNALTQLQAIQVEVQKWQQDMKDDLVQFRQALSVDSIETAFAKLRVNNTKQIEQ